MTINKRLAELERAVRYKERVILVHYEGDAHVCPMGKPDLKIPLGEIDTTFPNCEITKLEVVYGN